MVIFIMLLTLISCNNVKYNAIMYSSAQELLSDDFLKEKRVEGALYVNEESDGDDKYIRDKASPSSREFIIT